MTSKGVYTSTGVKAIHYGEGVLDQLPSIISSNFSTASDGKLPKSLIITGKSLATKTPLLKQVQDLLGDSVVATYTNIGEHAPIAQVQEAAKTARESGVQVLIALGGGSPIDSAKLVAYFNSQPPASQPFLPVVAIPTTLSAAELTMTAGYTNEEGDKAGAKDVQMSPKIIIYDPLVSLHTPQRLWISSGIRALDHAVEALYRPKATIVARYQALDAIELLFSSLTATRDDPSAIQPRLDSFTAAWLSLGTNVVPNVLGLSHSLGHALGATWSIPHGITSCITLSPSLRLLLTTHCLPPPVLSFLSKAYTRLPSTYKPSSLENETDEAKAYGLATTIQNLIDDLGLNSKAGNFGVKKEDCSKLAKKVTTGLLGCGGGWGDESLGGKIPQTEEIEKMLEGLL